MAIRIITDSTSDINLEQAAEMGITIIPLKVIFGDKEYKEGLEISMEVFYQKLVQAEKLPTTSQPAPDDFLEYFQEAKDAGDSVVAILISGKLSGTVQSAMIAREMVDYSEIYVIDSLSATAGLRLLVEHAACLRDQGKNVDQITKEIEYLKEKIVFLAMVDTLEFLQKGGRLSKSSAILGSLLKFKPIITLKDGVIGVVGKERGTNKGIAKMLDTIDEVGTINSTFPVVFGYTAEDSKAVLLKEKAIEKYGMKEHRMYPVGCVVGTHAGPGACVIAYIRK
jgi:DegV family protein with EDD domain